MKFHAHLLAKRYSPSVGKEITLFLRAQLIFSMLTVFNFHTHYSIWGRVPLTVQSLPLIVSNICTFFQTFLLFIKRADYSNSSKICTLENFTGSSTMVQVSWRILTLSSNFCSRWTWRSHYWRGFNWKGFSLQTAETLQASLFCTRRTLILSTVILRLFYSESSLAVFSGILTSSGPNVRVSRSWWLS